jgi:long-chain acyl-CoA synthetase
VLARPEVREHFAAAVARVNAQLAPFEQIKKFDLLERELSQDTGELTPSLKVKRRVLLERHAEWIEAMYEGAAQTAA